MDDTTKRQWEEFDRDGEALVQQKLASKQHYSESKEQQAKAWLDQRAKLAREKSEAEQITIARSADNVHNLSHFQD